MDSELVIELRRLEQQRSTGVLSAGDGAFHLVEGAITAAECERTTGLDRLVVASGTATAEQWRRARTGGLDGLLERPRLETLSLLSVFDAAYFLLSAPAARPEFRSGPPHWLARACRITPGALLHECARRESPDSESWPVDLVDTATVVPVRRVRRRRVVLTGGQAEVLAAIDSRRTITELATELGRTTYGCLLAVRELTAAGLVEPPSMVVQAAPPPGGPPPARHRAEPSDRSEESTVISTATDESMPPLRRRVRRAAAVAVPDRWEPPDRDVLVRLRAALEELT
ncbi:hypothetical protein [Nocardia sp. NBC_00511]|uniref:hypothetical protein n=1 Tax=Nocardia sp. NBC_00511 TaxID=2903591 RepID=UPI0030E2D2ED